MKRKNLISKVAICLYLVLATFLFAGCNLRADKGEDLHKTNILEVQVIKENLTYIYDERTGLCFAVLNNHTDGFRSTFTITCVPCDSLKSVEVSK